MKKKWAESYAVPVYPRGFDNVSSEKLLVNKAECGRELLVVAVYLILEFSAILETL